MQYIIHIKAYMACFTKVDIMLLKLQYKLQKLSLMNSWKVCYPKCLDSSMNLHTAIGVLLLLRCPLLRLVLEGCCHGACLCI